MVKREELPESVQLTWQWKWTTPEEAKYWCEAAGVDYHEVSLQTFHAESSQYLFFSSQVAAGGPMHQVQWHCLPFIVTAQLPLTTSYWEEARLFKSFVDFVGISTKIWRRQILSKIPKSTSSCSGATARAFDVLWLVGKMFYCYMEGVPPPPPPALRHLPKEGT